MQTIFELDFNKKDSPEIVLERMLKEFAPKLTETDYAYKTLKGIFRHRKEILEIIQKYAPQWPVEKIAKIDRAVLEIGVYEIMFNREIPNVVAINEGVEIAKHFGDNNSPKFINGVLSSVMTNCKKTKTNGKIPRSRKKAKN
jgi:N utilization substance protein B